MNRPIIFALALLLFALPSYAAAPNWGTCSAGNEVVTNISIGGPLCFDLDPTNASTDSVMLRVDKCDNIDIVYEGNMAADTAVPNTSVQIMSCVSSSVSANTCKPIDNLTLTGADGSFEIMGAAAAWIYVKETTDPDDQTPRVLVKCN